MLLPPVPGFVPLPVLPHWRSHRLGLALADPLAVRRVLVPTLMCMLMFLPSSQLMPKRPFEPTGSRIILPCRFNRDGP